MTLNELKAKWASDCIIDEQDLSGAALRTSQLHSFYISEALSIKMQLVKMQMEIAQLQVLRGRYFRGELTSSELKENEWEQWQFKTLKADINPLILASDDVQKLIGREEYLKIILYFLESVLGEIKSRSFNIKTAVEFIKWRSGS
jgi:hypothetical protein